MDELKEYVKNLWKLDPKLATLLSFVANSILADEVSGSMKRKPDREYDMIR